ncbi:MAG: GNAT family N-acetyltransferase [Chloroflexi bacterium]|nr:GNAT family N-acetyltransferase [Chloroflexota bacterium]
MLQGILVNLVAFDKRFIEREVSWLRGPMREWWGQDGLATETSQQPQREQRRANSEAGRLSCFGIETKDGLPIGTFVLVDIDPYHRTAEVGAGIGDPAYWSGGYGSDAMLLIVQYGFDWLDLRRLWLTTRGDNFRAQRQIEKCGFTREGAQRLKISTSQGEYRDFLYYGLLREEWPGRDEMVERLKLREKAEAQLLRAAEGQPHE